MPIEFAPPPPATQGYQITPPQSTDPLQTLAQMGQLRTQGLQQQTAQMENEQRRMQLDSQKDILAGMVNSGGDMDKFLQYTRRPGSKVLPADALAVQQHLTQMKQEAATLDKTTRENTTAGIDQYRGLLTNVQTPEDLAAANAKADQLGIPKTVPRHTQFSDPAHVQAFSNSLGGQAQLYKEATERETQAKERAQAGLAGVQTVEAQQKVDVGEKAAVAQEMQAAGELTPAVMADIQKRHPKVILPTTKEGLDRFVRSVVPAEKQPEYDINAIKAKLGLMGNTEFDQYQLRFAQSIGKKPSDLSFPEMQKVLQLYAKDKQDPNMLAAILALKGSQQQMAAAQVSALPSDSELEAEARDYRNLDMPPGRIAAMREGRIQYFPQILQKARAQAAAEGQPFSPATLEAKYDTWLSTEKAFADGEEAGMVRSFGNLMKHSAMGVKASEALSHHDLPALQRIAGALHVAAGGSEETVYDTIASFVADEASKAFLPGGGGQSERAEKAAHFERSLGDKQRTNNFKALMGLADSQGEELERQYAEGTFGKGPRIGRLFSPDVLKARDTVLGKKPSAPQLQYVRHAAGPNGHTIGQTADGKWHDEKTGAVIQ
jgi:hypothetical protein